MLKLRLRLRVISYVIGLGCVVSSCGWWVWVLLTIALTGDFRAIEPNALIIWTEVAVSIVALVFVGYLFVDYVVLLRMIPKEVRKEMKLEA